MTVSADPSPEPGEPTLVDLLRCSVKDGIDPVFLAEQVTAILREHIATEIEAEAAPIVAGGLFPEFYAAYNQGVNAAAKIARGDR